MAGPHLIQIAALDDPRLNWYRDLARANLTQLSGRFIVEGKLMVERLAASSYPIESIVVDGGRTELLPSGLPDATEVYLLPPGAAEKLIGFNFHRGLLACGRRRPAPAVTELLDAPAGNGLFVACVEIADPTNLGGIIRNAAAFGADGVFLTPGCPDPFSRRVLRVSMGTALEMSLATGVTAMDLLELCRERGVRSTATTLDPTATELDQFQCRGRLVVFFGNEGHGLPAAVVQRCDDRLTITMSGQTDSLNAAVASGVFLHHLSRRPPPTGKP